MYVWWQSKEGWNWDWTLDFWVGGSILGSLFILVKGSLKNALKQSQNDKTKSLLNDFNTIVICSCNVKSMSASLLDWFYLRLGLVKNALNPTQNDET